MTEICNPSFGNAKTHDGKQPQSPDSLHVSDVAAVEEAELSDTSSNTEKFNAIEDDDNLDGYSVWSTDGKPRLPVRKFLSAPRWRLFFGTRSTDDHDGLSTPEVRELARHFEVRPLNSEYSEMRERKPIDITEAREFNTRQTSWLGSKQVCYGWRHDVCYFLLGCVITVTAMLVPHYIGSFPAGLDVLGEFCSAHASPADLHMPASSSAQVHGMSKPHGKYAFVQMAFDVPWKPPVHVWRVLPMARLLQSLSKFPLVLLTNTSHFPDGTNVTDAFRKLDVILLPCHRVPLSENWASKLPKRWLIPYWKLQIWRLTDFEKLIWIDTDTIFFRSMDWLFEYDGVWGQRDNWVCKAREDEQNWLCSGLLLIKPDEAIYQDMVRYAQTGARKWYTNGDQKLIRNYFEYVKGEPVKLLSTADASFGKCVGHTPGIPYHSFGPWNMPSFVHKSSVYNECFDHNPAVQLKKINGSTVNICHFHPLGPYWRNLFCEATNIAGVQTQLSAHYCNDVRWYGNER